MTQASKPSSTGSPNKRVALWSGAAPTQALRASLALLIAILFFLIGAQAGVRAEPAKPPAWMAPVKQDIRDLSDRSKALRARHEQSSPEGEIVSWQWSRLRMHVGEIANLQWLLKKADSTSSRRPTRHTLAILARLAALYAEAGAKRTEDYADRLIAFGQRASGRDRIYAVLGATANAKRLETDHQRAAATEAYRQAVDFASTLTGSPWRKALALQAEAAFQISRNRADKKLTPDARSALYARAETELRTALALIRRAPPPSSSVLPPILLDLSQVLGRASRAMKRSSEQAETEEKSLLEEALRINTGLWHTDIPSIEILKHLAWLVPEQDRAALRKRADDAEHAGWPEKLAYFDRQLQVAETLYGENSAEVLVVLTRVDGHASSAGETDKSVAYAKRALAVEKSLYGQELAPTLFQYAIRLSLRGHHERAAVLERRVLDIYQASLGADDQETRAVKRHLDTDAHWKQRMEAIRNSPGMPQIHGPAADDERQADQLADTRHYKEAEALYRKAIAASYGIPNLLVDYKLAGVLRAQGRMREAAEAERPLRSDPAFSDMKHDVDLQMVAQGLSRLRDIERTHDADSYAVADQRASLADLYRLAGEFAKAVSMYRLALPHLRQYGDTAISQAQSGLARALVALGRFPEARLALRGADEGDPDVLSAWAYLHLEAGETAEAAVYARRLAHRIQGATFTKREPVLLRLAQLERRLGQYADAEKLCRELLRMHATQGETTSLSDAAKISLASVLADEGRYAEASSLLNGVAERNMYGNRFGMDSIAPLLTLAVGLAHEGKSAEAEKWATRALSIRERRFGPSNSRTASADMVYAFVISRAGKTAEAEKYYRRALATREATLPPEHSDIARARLALAQILEHAGKFRSAEAMLEKAATVLRTNSGAQSPDTIEARGRLGLLRAVDLSRPADGYPDLKAAADGTWSRMRDRSVAASQASARQILKSGRWIFVGQIEAAWGWGHAQ